MFFLKGFFATIIENSVHFHHRTGEAVNLVKQVVNVQPPAFVISRL